MECTSFPYAYRSMWYAVQKGIEKGLQLSDITRNMVIIAPTKDVHGDLKQYKYAAATEMATNSGLLSVDGKINSKEFKHR